MSPKCLLPICVALTCLFLAPPAMAFGEKAAAEIKDRSGAVIGNASLIEASGGVLIRLKLKGLPPGPHGLRIHDTGKCEGDFASAGEILNPLGAKHGFLNEEGPMAGNLPNIHASASGDIDVEFLNHFISLAKDAPEPLLDADGVSIVVLEKADDQFSEPEGNAGARIACGVVSAVN